MTEKANLEALINEELTDEEELAWDFAMEISGSVYKRMSDLGWKKKDLAKRMGVSPARISRILSGKQKMTLTTLAHLCIVLGIDMGYGFGAPRILMPQSAMAKSQSITQFEFAPQRTPMTASLSCLG